MKEPSLSAKLSDFSISQILGIFSQFKKTGKILVQGKINGEIFIEEGRCTHASKGEIEGIDALFELAQATEGEIFFIPALFANKHTITGDASSLFEQIEKRSMEIRELKEKLPPLDSIIVKSDTPPDENLRLRKTDWKILALVDGKRNIRKIIEDSGLGAIESYRSLHFLFDIGLVVDPEESKRKIAELMRLINLFTDELSKGQTETKKSLLTFIRNTVSSFDPSKTLSQKIDINEKGDEFILKAEVNLAPSDIESIMRDIIPVFTRRLENEFGKILAKKKYEILMRKIKG